MRRMGRIAASITVMPSQSGWKSTASCRAINGAAKFVLPEMSDGPQHQIPIRVRELAVKRCQKNGR
jgi:hypothetical protein